MGGYDSISSSAAALNEQVARQIFNIMPQQGLVVVIIDKEGNCWPSDSEKFASLNFGESFLKNLRAKIDGVTEPVVTQVDDFTLVSTQLSTEKTDCGYLIIALPHYSLESTLENIHLIEMLLNQVGLIAGLIEKNALLYELQFKNSASNTQD